MKLEKLSEQQLEKMEEVKQHWLDYIFSCKNSIDREKAKIGIDWLYKLAGRDEPIVIYVDSPLACQYAVVYLKEYVEMMPKIFSKDQVGAQVWDQVRDQVGAQVWDQVRDQVWDQVGDQVGAQVWDQVGDQVGAQVWDQVRDQVWDQVGDQVRAQVRDQEIEYQSFAQYGSISDYGWISFFDFFTQIGIINHEKFNQFKSIISSGVYDMIQLNGFCIVSDLPNKISRNSNNRLHSSDGAAIEFKDGYKQYYWNGVSVPRGWIESPEKINHKTITEEKNAEKRRCIREIIGTQRFAELLSIEEIDRDHVNDQDVVLFKTKSKDDITNDFIYYVNVTCHSTKRQYFLCVPEAASKNAWSAVSWTFGMTEKKYKPIFES